MATSRNTTTLGRRIRDRRTDLGLTQDQLSELSSVSQGAISRIEHGACPSLATLQLLRGSLAITQSEWLTWLDLLAPDNGGDRAVSA